MKNVWLHIRHRYYEGDEKFNKKNFINLRKKQIKFGLINVTIKINLNYGTDPRQQKAHSAFN